MIKIIVDTLLEKENLLKDSKLIHNSHIDICSTLCELHLNPNTILLANEYKLIKVFEHNSKYLDEKITIHHIK